MDDHRCSIVLRYALMRIKTHVLALSVNCFRTPRPLRLCQGTREHAMGQ